MRKKDIAAGRNGNLDLIRSLAVLLVVTVHFFSNTGYYDRVVAGPPMIVMTMIRTFAMICVPLFLLLSGYLCSHKKLNGTYFLRIIPILLTYLLACIVTLAVRRLVWKDEFSLMWALSQIIRIDLGAVTYAWYVEMYIGLYLLIPFLNILFHNLGSKRDQQLLIAVLLVLTMVPISSNIYDLSTPGFWKDPSISQEYHDLVPGWWIGIWPLTYYYLGAYIREYGVGISKKTCMASLVVTALLLFTGYNLYRSQNTVLFLYDGDSWGGLQNMVLSVLVFGLLLQLNVEKWPKMINGVLQRISKLSLGIYLCSYMTDISLYRLFNSLELPIAKQLAYMPTAIVTSFVLAALAAQMIAWVQTGIIWGVENIANRFKRGKS